MADLYGSHFEYAGKSSRDYGLIFAVVEGMRNTSVSGTISGITTFDKKNQRRFLVEDDYRENPLTYEVEIVAEDGRMLDVFTRREVEKWLFNRHNYRKLYLDIDDDCDGEMSEIIRGLQYRLYLNCRFINARRLELNGGVIGYAATIESDTGYWWQDPVTQTFQPYNFYEASVSVISVGVDTDIDEYIYPALSITMGRAGGDLVLVNNADDETRQSKFIGLPADSVIQVKGEINFVSGNYYEKFVIPNFPRLVDGTNNISIQGNVASISFTFQNRRML